MKKIKNILIALIVLFSMPLAVKAGTIGFGNPVRISANTYEFALTVTDLSLNYTNGNIDITNGKISKITMSSGWQNKTGINNNFYFYHDGISSGNFTIAKIQVTMTDNSKYTINNLNYGTHKCVQEPNGLIFGENGTIVSKNVYNNTCGLSDDATLKLIFPTSGILSPSFSSTRLNYSLTVGKDINSVSFYTETNNSKATVISGNTCNLVGTYTTCSITVQAERKNTLTYKVVVYKEGNGSSSIDNHITNFQVHGGTLEREFNENVYEYNLRVDKNASKVYFSFNTNNGPNISDSCNAIADICTLTVTLSGGNIKKYTFNFINENTTYPNQTSNTGNSSSNSNKNGSSNKTNNTNTSNKKTNSSTSSTSNNQSNPSSNEEKNNQIINPIENIEKVPNNKEEDKSVTANENPENIKKVETKKEDEKETITLPIINIEVSKNVYLGILAALIFIFGIIIGRYLRYRR